MSYIDLYKQQWNNSGIAFYEGTNTYKLASALMSEYDRLAQEIQNIYDAQHINTAESLMLEELALPVNLPRKSGESDDKYRERIKLAYRLHFVEGTYDEIAEFAIALLGTDEFDLIEDFGAKPATLELSAPQQSYENSVLTLQEAKDFLSQTVVAGHRIILTQSGSFLLRGDGDPNVPENGLSGVGFDGGTLAGNL